MEKQFTGSRNKYASVFQYNHFQYKHLARSYILSFYVMMMNNSSHQVEQGSSTEIHHGYQSYLFMDTILFFLNTDILQNICPMTKQIKSAFDVFLLTIFSGFYAWVHVHKHSGSTIYDKAVSGTTIKLWSQYNFTLLWFWVNKCTIHIMLVSNT